MDWDWDWVGLGWMGLDLRVGGGIERLTVLIREQSIFYTVCKRPLTVADFRDKC